jgi:hypothetical protein
MVVWLAAALLVGRLASGQENQPPPQPENPLRAIEIQQKRLNLEQRQSEVNFNNEMRKVELEKKRMELEHQRQMLKAQEPKAGPGKEVWRGRDGKIMHCLGLVFLCFVVNVLLAIWVYQDIRKRNAGSGIWIAITLLTGFFGALVYAVVRLGDKPA